VFLLLASTMCAGLFCGAALYVNLVEHPARMPCGQEMAVPKQLDIRISARQRNPHLAHADANQGADLQQLQANRGALGLGSQDVFVSENSFDAC